MANRSISINWLAGITNSILPMGPAKTAESGQRAHPRNLDLPDFLFTFDVALRQVRFHYTRHLGNVLADCVGHGFGIA